MNRLVVCAGKIVNKQIIHRPPKQEGNKYEQFKILQEIKGINTT
jgi:hypothetical protein